MTKKVTKLRTNVIVVVVVIKVEAVSNDSYIKIINKRSTINHKSNIFKVLLLNGKNTPSARVNYPNIISDSTSCRVMLLP